MTRVVSTPDTGVRDSYHRSTPSPVTVLTISLAAFGLDRLVAILGGQESIRDFIAFPKNNSGRDVMIDAPAPIDPEQLEELHLQVKK